MTVPALSPGDIARVANTGTILWVSDNYNNSDNLGGISRYALLFVIAISVKGYALVLTDHKLGYVSLKGAHRVI